MSPVHSLSALPEIQAPGPDVKLPSFHARHDDASATCLVPGFKGAALFPYVFTTLRLSETVLHSPA